MGWKLTAFEEGLALAIQDYLKRQTLLPKDQWYDVQCCVQVTNDGNAWVSEMSAYPQSSERNPRTATDDQ